MQMNQFKQYLYLMRMHKPIGIFLLLWPTLWALWLAGDGQPNLFIVIIFILGVIIMRAAGCIINDFADRNFDGHVERTRDRPLVTKKISTRSALILFSVLILCAFMLVLLLNRLTLYLAVVGAVLTVFYPFMKRFTHLPQLGLGVAFAWSVPMAFAALTDAIPRDAWLVFFAAAIWPVIYDTIYAMVDRVDDEKIGIKSTAILFGKNDRLIIGILQLVFLWVLVWIGVLFYLSWLYYLGLVFAAGFCCYQQWLLSFKDRGKYFSAFLNNHLLGMVVFAGIVLSYLI